MATPIVKNPDEDLVECLCVRAAEHGRSAEAEHREILKANLVGGEQHAALEQATSRLAEFRRRTTGRGSPSSADLLEASRRSRAEDLAGKDT